MPSSVKKNIHFANAKDLHRFAKAVEWKEDSPEEQYYFIQTCNMLTERLFGTVPLIQTWQRVPPLLRNTIGAAVQKTVELSKQMASTLAVFAWDIENYLGWDHQWYLK